MMTKQVPDRHTERGNVLFLILIAVALFAALSYAITQSTRSGSGDSSSEKNKIGSAQLAQYPAGIKTAIVRMMLDGRPVDDILFDAPRDYGDTFYATESGQRFNVFHPAGGGSVYQNAPAELLVSGANSAGDTGDDEYKGAWVFSANYQINGIGITESSDSAANDVIAFLPGLKQSVCRKLNEEVGITDAGETDKIPVNFGGSLSAAPVMADAMRAVSPGARGIPSGGATGTIGGTTPGDSSVLRGQPYGCTRIGAAGGQWPATKYVYYQVLVER